MRCPICGDSQKSKSKARGWLLEREDKDTFHYFCHNCGASQSFSLFLKNIDGLLYKDYITEKYINKIKDEKLTTIKKTRFETTKIKENPLKTLKKISQLDPSHPLKKYIEKRKIPSNQHYRLYYAPKFKTWVNSIIPNKFQNTEKDEPRLVIPFIDKEGEVFGVSARGFDPNGIRYITIMFDERPKIFGLDKVDFTKTYFVVEGAIDSMFLSNAVAMAGADGNMDGLENLENAIVVYDNEPRNKEIHKRMEKIINQGYSICIWPPNIIGKDINEMILNGFNNIEDIILKNTYKGLEANLKLISWKKT
jgi:hypothetical protein